MYISTAITYQTHIEAGQGRGRSVADEVDDDDDDEDDDGDDHDDQIGTLEKIFCWHVLLSMGMVELILRIFVQARSLGLGNRGSRPLQGGLGGGEGGGHHHLLLLHHDHDNHHCRARAEWGS